MTARAAISKSDIKRYVQAMTEAGVREFAIEATPDGTHRIKIGDGPVDKLGPDPDELLNGTP